MFKKRTLLLASCILFAPYSYGQDVFDHIICANGIINIEDKNINPIVVKGPLIYHRDSGQFKICFPAEELGRMSVRLFGSKVTSCDCDFIFQGEMLNGHLVLLDTHVEKSTGGAACSVIRSEKSHEIVISVKHDFKK